VNTAGAQGHTGDIPESICVKVRAAASLLEEQCVPISECLLPQRVFSLWGRLEEITFSRKDFWLLGSSAGNRFAAANELSTHE